MAAVKRRERKTETSDAAKMRRRDEAKMLVENPMFIEAMEAVYEFWDAYWKKTPPGPTGASERELAHQMLLAHGAFQHVLTKAIEDGTVSEATLEEVKKRTGGVPTTF